MAGFDAPGVIPVVDPNTGETNITVLTEDREANRKLLRQLQEKMAQETNDPSILEFGLDDFAVLFYKQHPEAQATPFVQFLDDLGVDQQSVLNRYYRPNDESAPPISNDIQGWLTDENQGPRNQYLLEKKYATQPAAPPPGTGDVDLVTGLTQAATEGGLYGFGSEVMANKLVDTWRKNGDIGSETSDEDAYKIAYDTLERQRNRFRGQEPGYAAAAEFGGSLLTGGALVKALKSIPVIGPGVTEFLSKPSGSATLAGLEGTLYGAGKSEGTPEERLGQGAVTAPFAALFGALAPSSGRLVAPVSREQAGVDAAKYLRNMEGVTSVSAGQATQNPRLAKLEAALGGKAFSDLYAQGEKEFTRATLSRLGIDSTEFSDEVIKKAVQKGKEAFNQLEARNQSYITPQQLDEIQQLVASASTNSTLTNSEIELFKRIRERLAATGAATGTITGKEYKELRSKLSGMIDYSSAPDKSRALKTVIDDLDDNTEAWITANNVDDLGKFAEARQYWRDLQPIRVLNIVAPDATANRIIRPETLKKAVQFIDPYSAEKNLPYNDLIYKGEQVLRPPNKVDAEPNKFATVVDLLRRAGGAGALLGGGAGYKLAATTGMDPALASTAGGVAGAAADLAAQRMLGSALMSKPVQAYLREQPLAKAAPSVVSTVQAAVPSAATAAVDAMELEDYYRRNFMAGK